MAQELKAKSSGEIRARDAMLGYWWYEKSEADKAIAEKDKQIAELKALLKSSILPTRTCRKCGRAGTLMFTPLVDNNNGRYWKLYNKGIDYVFCIKCAHCSEVAFVTKQTHEYELRHQKYKRCVKMASNCRLRARWFGDNSFYKKEQWALRWHKRWLELAEKFKEAK